MIRLLPFLMLSAFSSTVADLNANGYNAKCNCEMHLDLCGFNDYNIYQSISLIYYGQLYFNNDSNYEYRFTELDLSIILEEYSYYNSFDISYVLNSGGVDNPNTFDITINNIFSGNFPYISIVVDNDTIFTMDYINDSLNSMYEDYFESIQNDNIVNYQFDLSDSTYVDSLNYSIAYGSKSINDGDNFLYDAGYYNGYNVGYEDGVDTGYTQGDNAGYLRGYSSGYEDGSTQDEQALAIFSGIIAIGMIPINFFLAIFNFEIFGINISAFITSLLSICVVLIVIKRTLAIKED